MKRFLDFAAVEAFEILSAHKSAVAAVADALIEHGTLNALEIDALIAAAEARDALEIEKLRRKPWTATLADTEAFKAHCISREY